MGVQITNSASLVSYETIFADMLKKLHEGEISSRDLNSKYIRQNYKDLLSQTNSGYGKTFDDINEKGYPDTTALKMKENLFKFSGAKNYTMLTDMNNLMYENGQKLPFNEFKDKALKLNSAYNVNYLQAEWQTSNQAGIHANNWKAFQKNKDKYPNLKYKTQGDNAVRDEHKKLNNIIAPIDSDFWAKIYPPNGWRCRCYVVQTAENISENIPTKTDDILPEFIGNVGISGEVFNENPIKGAKPHPYFALAKKGEMDGKIMNQHFRFLQEEAISKLKDKTILNRNSKLTVAFSAKSLKHAFNKNSDNYEDKNQIIYHLDSILQHAQYLGYTPPFHKDEQEVATHVYLIQINGINNYVLVREFKNKEMLFYSISESEKVLIGIKK